MSTQTDYRRYQGRRLAFWRVSLMVYCNLSWHAWSWQLTSSRLVGKIRRLETIPPWTSISHIAHSLYSLVVIHPKNCWFRQRWRPWTAIRPSFAMKSLFLKVISTAKVCMKIFPLVITDAVPPLCQNLWPLRLHKYERASRYFLQSVFHQRSPLLRQLATTNGSTTSPRQLIFQRPNQAHLNIILTWIRARRPASKTSTA
jgi:hypothetical protein